MPYQIKEINRKLNNAMPKLEKSYYKEVCKLNTVAYVTKEPVKFEDRFKGEKITLKEHEKWGDLWDCAWFNFTGEIPNELHNEDIVLLIDINGEGLLVDNEGNAVIGLTTGSVAYEFCTARKRVIPINLIDVKDGKIDIWIDGGCNDLFGRYVKKGELEQACIAKRYKELRSLYYDISTLKSAMENTSPDNPRHHSILFSIDKSLNELYDYTEEEAIKSRAILKKELDKKGGDPSLKLSAIGHAHIDLAWLWPIRETKRKGARTFSTVMRLMELYPDYKFGASQPQLFLWMKENYPDLYEQMKKRIKEKRFEVQGAMWVEADTNVSGGEALVRQVLYGKKYYKDEFGIDVKNLWLPDVFGYSGALPQILKKSDVPYFMTQKLSWNHQNNFPYHTFNWQGIDGSSVLTHMLPEETYNSPASPETIRSCEKKYHEKGQCEDALVLFGIGDGGGGPGAHHLERLQRIKNMADFSPVEQRFACDFFETIAKNIDSYHTWVGELYFECHRGTYTTQANNKKYNRKMENAIRELEFACVIAKEYADEKYPQEQIEKIWKEMLLYQFHDILPGSSIKRVYDESVARYKKLLSEVTDLTNEMYKKVTTKDTGYAVFNSLSFDRNEYVKIDDTWYNVNVKAMSATNVDKNDIALKSDNVKSTDNTIENENIKVEFSENGSIVSIFDKKNNKESLRENANVFDVYEDDGDAWDFYLYYDQRKPRQFKLLNQSSNNDGIEASMNQEYIFGNSKLTQKIILKKDDNKVIFQTNVDWQETNKMLRTSFPVNVDTTEATCNIQFGNLKRPTIRNTTWDIAKYEVCAHKWVDMSRDDYGVAMLSESKYGFKLVDNIIDINLLRSPMYPGENADKGTHFIKYAIFPHAGNEKSANVVKEGYLFNFEPVIIKDSSIAKNVDIKVALADKKNIVVEAIKKAENTDEIIVRLYEATGENTVTNVSLCDKFKSAKICNLVERDIEDLAINNNNVNLKFTPYEIKTLKLSL